MNTIEVRYLHYVRPTERTDTYNSSNITIGYVDKITALELTKHIAFDLKSNCHLHEDILGVYERDAEDIKKWLIQNELRKEVEK